MAFDLGRALFRKQEFESARLDDFEFRLRARTMRALAALVGVSPQLLAGRIAIASDDELIAELSEQTSISPAKLRESYERCRAEERQRLISERGDPAPHRLT